jgi:hypothetical protein
MRNIQKFNDDHLDKLLIKLDKEKMHNSFPKTVFHTFKKVQNRTSHILGLNRDVLEEQKIY